jgi:hypothetical protein
MAASHGAEDFGTFYVWIWVLTYSQPDNPGLTPFDKRDGRERKLNVAAPSPHSNDGMGKELY